MKERSGMPYDVVAYEADDLAMQLNEAEEGLFHRMLRRSWMNGSIPADLIELSRICRTHHARLKKAWIRLSKLWQPHPSLEGRLINLKQERERAWVEAKSDASRRAIVKRWNDQKLKELADTDVVRTKYDRNTSPSPSPSPSLSSTNVEEREIAHSKKQKTHHVAPFSDEFLQFWDSYPRKIGKQAAWKAWIKLNGSRPELTILIHAIELQSHSAQWQDHQYIPYASTWLHRGQWDDQIENGICRHRNLNPDLYVAPNEEWDRIADKANAPMKAWMDAHKK